MNITRRDALKQTAALAAATVLAPSLLARAETSVRAVVLPGLPYPHDALEPVIDTLTMQIHHGKHHAGYVNNLNKALSALPGQAPLEQILTDINALPEALRTSVRNNGGGAWNHDLFWQSMAPAGQGGGGEPTGELAQRIQADFGSFAAFQEQFAKAAATRFGSGWAWLIQRPDGTLAVSSTPNQDNPLMKGLVPEGDLGSPLLGLDVWEHAYYLHYQNRRADYIAQWWKVVNWPAVAARLV